MAGSRLQSFFEKRWYGKPGVLQLLQPLEYIYGLAVSKRKNKLLQNSYIAPVPIVIVGNISVGGTGKTPTIIALINFLQQKGFHPGVVSRGYGRIAEKNIELVNEASTSAEVGDEPLLIYNKTKCPIVVSRDRVAAVKKLLASSSKNNPCDVIISDDGLQHYNLGRNFEIAVIDGSRLFGNGHLLPVGPLRELPERLNSVDWVFVNNTKEGSLEAIEGQLVNSNIKDRVQEISLKIGTLVSLKGNNSLLLSELNNEFNKKVDSYALAGIGNPQGFFSTLRAQIENIKTKSYSDHYCWKLTDLEQYSGKQVIVTGKDAVKWRELIAQNESLDARAWFFLDVEMSLPDRFLADFFARLSSWKPI